MLIILKVGLNIKQNKHQGKRGQHWDHWIYHGSYIEAELKFTKGSQQKKNIYIYIYIYIKSDINFLLFPRLIHIIIFYYYHYLIIETMILYIYIYIYI